ncbi:MAG: ACT domain-containing protein [Clostridiales bacterium]|jgi:ACT domain-containing protein|nr:ACT domain-containing protein [Clostridiales bacterium]
MRAFVTVVGKDKVGIIAAICILLAEKNVNILDISQTILQDCFTMIMLVDASDSTVPFDALGESLSELGRKMELTIRIQREEIFNAMHRI